MISNSGSNASRVYSGRAGHPFRPKSATLFEVVREPVERFVEAIKATLDILQPKRIVRLLLHANRR